MVYVITDGTGFVKIGIASDVKQRLQALQTGCPRDLSVVRLIKTRDDESTEYCIHAMLEHFRARPRANKYHSEWFSDECLNILNSLTDDQLWMITMGLHWRYTKATPLPGTMQNQTDKDTKIISQVQFTNLEKENSRLKIENKSLLRELEKLNKEVEKSASVDIAHAKETLIARLRAL